MNIFFISTIVIVGLSGIVAQILLLRELLVSFSGNELTIGIVLANWVISEALGVYLVGKYMDKTKSKVNVFIILQLVFSLMFPVAIYLSRSFKFLLGIPVSEAIGLYLIYICSLFIVLPVGFCHGALFSACAKVYSSKTSETAGAIGKVYTWEMLGTILGGIITTYLFIPFLSSFRIVFLISFINLTLCAGFFKDILKNSLKNITLSCLGLVILFLLFGGVNYLENASISSQWRNRTVLEYRNSIYGNITVTKQPHQYTFFYNGIPVITTPFPDITFVEEFGNLPLLFHPGPQEVLVVSAGAGGLIDQILKHPVKRIDYVEIDPLIIDMVKKYSTDLTERELSDKRVNIRNLDGRFFLRTNKSRYDVILIGLSNQSDLSTNRLFTQEFFTLARNRLKPEGIIALWMPGSLTYLSTELRDLNSCILNALKSAFNYVRIIPGDYNIYLASASEDIMSVTGKVISQRFDERAIKANVLVPDYIDYRLDAKWLDWFMQSLSGAQKVANQDYRPFAVYETLLFWNKKFSPKFFLLLEAFKNLNLKVVALSVFLLNSLILFAIKRSGNQRIAVVFSIGATGFFGMLTTLILTFCFQVYYGYLYYRIGLLISIFMAGASLGSLLMTTRLEKIKNRAAFFQGLEILIIAFSCIMALVISRFPGIAGNPGLIFIILFFISGALMGLQFPLASRLYMEEKKGVGETSGVLYSSDLIGGWVAGVLGGVVALPVLGLFNSCIALVMLKIGSFFIFSYRYKKTGI